MIAWLAATVAWSAPGVSSGGPTPEEVRLAVVVSSNVGLSHEETLAYADRDAGRVAGLLQEIGGYGRGDVWVVANATTDDVYATLTRVTVRAQEVVAAGGQPSLLLYYAGHASPDGLHVRGEVLPLPDVKAAIRVIPALDRIVVLDACHAGTIARSRGASLVEVSDRPAGFEPPIGEAWIASSGPEERSFEVEDRRGALFTHFFLSGARGAADADADHRVTLGELYSFVRAQTAAAAADLGQLQEPRWSGALGQFALTDLGASATGVRVAGPVSAPLLVVDERAEDVVAEIPRGGGASLALPAGRYQVVSRAERVSVGRLTVPEGGWTVWSPEQQLSRGPAVRTRGGTYDLSPWRVGAGYTGGLGGAVARVDRHGGYLELGRALGRGNQLAIVAGGGWVPHTTAWSRGADLGVDLWAGWTREVWGRGPLTLAPGLAATAGWSRRTSERAPHPTWGVWYGDRVDRTQIAAASVGASAGLEVALELGAVDLRSWWGIGAVGWLADTPALTPTASLRLGLATEFR